MITATKRIEFDAAHRVAGHEGKCKSLHGHRYAAEFTFVRTDGRGTDDAGFVIDFGVIKARVGKWIDDNLDHTTLFDKQDELMVRLYEKLIALAQDERAPVNQPPKESLMTLRPWFPMDCPPTAENIASLLWTKATSLAPKGVEVVRVRVYETPTSFAEYEYTASLHRRS